MIKILNNFRFLRGRDSGKGSTPALVPPDQQSVLRSISVFESVDILCEGPIYGLVDQFGKKVYGLDMLKGIYLNKIPVMNAKGEYNFRNVLMEINLGTENQTPLANFRNVYIFKPSTFKLLGPIREGATSEELRPHPDGGPVRDFVSWARGPNGWPSGSQDSFVFVHHVKNKDVKKVKIGLLIENLFDTVSEGRKKGEAGKMGLSRSTSMSFNLTYGLEGTRYMVSRAVTVTGTVNSPFAVMIGEDRKYTTGTTTSTTIANRYNLPESNASGSSTQNAEFSNQALTSLSRISGGTISLSDILFYLDPGNQASYTSGSACYDLISSGEGLINGAVYYGPNRPSFSFDGTDDNIRFASSLLNKPYNGKTIIIAARLGAHLANDSFMALWGTNTARNFGTWLHRNSSGQYYIHFSTGAVNSYSGDLSSIIPIVIGQWFLITVTQTTAGYVTYYFNGNNYGSKAQVYSQFIDATYEYIGTGGASPWNGNIGSVLIYKRNLTETEHLRIYNEVMKEKYGIV